MRKIFVRLSILSVAAASVAACGPAIFLAGGMVGPETVSANENGITVQVYNGGSDKKALEIATKHCAQYSKSAKMISRNVGGTQSGGSIIYECV